MKRRMAILRTVTVAALAIAIGGAALGSDIRVTVASANAAQDNGASAAQHATLNVDLQAMAANVVSALVGGENPSTFAKHDEISTQANADRRGDKPEKAEKADKAKDADEDNDNDEATETEVKTNVSAGQQLAPTGTAGTRPGFGCGDKNHEHSGPPGRPGASLPPGCTKNH
jgi:hypothetical protein